MIKTKETLILVLNEGTADYDFLSDAVHDEASMLATSVNNDGVDAQVDYLVSRGWSLDEILERAMEADK